MEQWYQSLNEHGLISGPFTVAGYSLSGHLATAFNLMHGDDPSLQQVITFNGAGVGKIGDGSLATTKQQLPEMIGRFLELRSQAGTAAGLEDQRPTSLMGACASRSPRARRQNVDVA